jgi:NAD+ synthase
MPLLANPKREIQRITEWMRISCRRRLNRRGFVVGVSGGVDSATVLYLAVRAMGREQVLACALPDRDSDPASARIAIQMANSLGVETISIELTRALEALGCYENRDSTIGRVIQGFDPHRDKAKIVLPQDLLENGSLNVFTVVAVMQDGAERRCRLKAEDLRSIIAASNMKQRTRMMVLYHEAERRHYAVAGTANKNEADLGFFVKYGDGGTDLQPISHLFKSEVYALAEELGVPGEIMSRPPTTDTYSASTTQTEFFYRLPFKLLDSVWCSAEELRPVSVIAAETGLPEYQVINALADLKAKARSSDYQRCPPLCLERDT